MSYGSALPSQLPDRLESQGAKRGVEMSVSGQLPGLADSNFSPAVLPGHVHRVRPVWRALARVVGLLLERYIKNPVLDRSCHFPGNA